MEPFRSTCTVEGKRATKDCKALDAAISERISSQCPKSIMSIKVASSQKKSIPFNPNTTATLYTKATVMAKATSVIIPIALSFISLTIPFRNGIPP